MTSAVARSLALVILVAAGCSKEKQPATTGHAPAAAQAVPPAVQSKTPSTAGTAVAGPKLCQHGVPADLCTQCNPEFVEVFKEKGDWCNEHGMPESQCRKCNPNLTFTANATAAPKEPWCREHGVPEAKCTKCNPKLVAKFVEAGDFCREHGFPESVCPYCHPEIAKAAGQPAPVFPPPGTQVRFASPDIEAKAGIQTVAVEEKPFADALEVVGRLDFNQNRLAQVSARGDAVVAEVKVDVGDKVKAGQALVVLTSAGVGSTQANLASARARVEVARAAAKREEGLSARGISPRKAVEEARAALTSAEADFQAAAAGLRAAGATQGSGGGRYVLTAPFAGTVVFRDAVSGKTVAAGQTLIRVADVTTMWAMLDVPEASGTAVKPGQRVSLRFEGQRTPAREAEVTRVGASVDPHTRTVPVRVDLDNPGGVLKAGVFLRATIEVGATQGALLVPRDAVQRAESHDLVFVRTAPGVYAPVAVDVQPASAGYVAVAGALKAGDHIVTTGAFLLKTEILKDSIGAGCADD